MYIHVRVQARQVCVHHACMLLPWHLLRHACELADHSSDSSNHMQLSSVSRPSQAEPKCHAWQRDQLEVRKHALRARRNHSPIEITRAVHRPMRSEREITPVASQAEQQQLAGAGASLGHRDAPARFAIPPIVVVSPSFCINLRNPNTIGPNTTPGIHPAAFVRFPVKPVRLPAG